MADLKQVREGSLLIPPHPPPNPAFAADLESINSLARGCAIAPDAGPARWTQHRAAAQLSRYASYQSRLALVPSYYKRLDRDETLIVRRPNNSGHPEKVDALCRKFVQEVVEKHFGGRAVPPNFSLQRTLDAAGRLLPQAPARVKRR